VIAPTRPHAHLIGIGGSGMRSLADVLLGLNWTVSGSDLDVARLGDLAARGVRLFAGHAAAHVPPETQWSIATSAVAADNPELQAASNRGIPVGSYFEFLGRLMATRHGLAVAGTHGKSSTTAMAAQILVEAGLDPTAVFGAQPLAAASGGRAGQGPLMLVEACEYRANFLHLRPREAVLLAVEPDHFDCYDDLLQLEDAFGCFAALLPADGRLLVQLDSSSARRAAAKAVCPVETFGITAEADWSAGGLCAWHGRFAFEVHHRGHYVGQVALRVPGRHQVINALAAIALTHAVGVKPATILRALRDFRGLRRRLEMLGSRDGVAVVDDYAHHPTEIRAALAAVRQMYPGRRLCCVFQPHQASRTARLLAELAASLQNADTVLVADIFRAREGTPRPGEVTAADLAQRVRSATIDVPPLHQPDEILRDLQTRLTPGDVLITIGAGDIGRIGHEYLQRFREGRAAG
jgi:UDP-N-acetylmuramate--alanine ligase